MTRLERLFEKMTAILGRIDETMRVHEETVKANAPKAADIERAANNAIQMLRSKIGRFLQANYDNAGLRPESLDNKRPHLGLREVCGRPVVWCRVDGQRLLLRYGLPAGLSAEPGNKPGHHYVDKPTDRPYRAADSLNAGSVRSPQRNMALIDLSTATEYGSKSRSIFGAKLKRSIKKHALTGEQLSPRVRKYLRQSENVAVSRPGRVLKRKKGSVIIPPENIWRRDATKVRLGSSGITVVRPKPFWWLDSEQLGEIKTDLFNLMGFGTLKQA